MTGRDGVERWRHVARLAVCSQDFGEAARVACQAAEQINVDLFAKSRVRLDTALRVFGAGLATTVVTCGTGSPRSLTEREQS
jgi:hypothetical protein